MSHGPSAISSDVRTQPNTTDSPTIEVPTFLQRAHVATKLFFAAICALGGVASFCVGITITPFSPEAGIAAFTIGTSLFGLTGVLLFSELSKTAAVLSSRNITASPYKDVCDF